MDVYYSKKYGLELQRTRRTPTSNLAQQRRFLHAATRPQVDSAIHQINLYPVDTAIGFLNTYPLNRDLSDG